MSNLPEMQDDHVPSYEVDQYFPRSVKPDREQAKVLRSRYGLLRAYYKSRPNRYGEVQRWLNQARYGTTFDAYLAGSMKYAMLVGFIAGLFGVVIGGVYVAFTGIGSNGTPLYTMAKGHGSITQEAALVALIPGITLGLLAAMLAYVYRYYAPRSAAKLRGRGIDIALPHAQVYMYALSDAGLSFVEVVDSLADMPDYGEVAVEFATIRRDMELFGNDLFTALRTARNLTPSVHFEQFLDDTISVLDSGGDIAAFLDGQSTRYMEAAHEEQEEFLDTLAVLSELFVAGFVAAPLFLIVTLIVVSFLGGQTLFQLTLLNYVVFPLGMGLFLALIHHLSKPYTQTPAVDDPNDERPELGAVLRGLYIHYTSSIRSWFGRRWDDVAPSSVATDGGAVNVIQRDRRYAGYTRGKLYESLWGELYQPARLAASHPLYTLVVSVPLAVAVVAGAVLAGFVDLTVFAMLTDPVMTTTWLLVVPFFVVAVPLAAFHELQQRHNDAVVRRFPDALTVLASANRMGVPITEGLDMVARWSAGPLSTEFAKLRNDVSWNHDVSGALIAFASRVRVPQVSRIVRLIARGSQASGDLATVLSVAAVDSRNRWKLERARRRAMGSYTAIVVIGYLVYLFVVFQLSVSYLAPIEALILPQTGDTSLPIAVAAVPVDAYRAVLFHSALIQAVGSGLLAGKLANDSAVSGLKYSIALVALAVVVFAFI